MNVPDHPEIRRLMKYGYPEDDRDPVCPVCGEECSTIVFNKDDEIIGCDCCTTECSAEDVEECFK